jgi:HEAT repeat protein
VRIAAYQALHRIGTPHARELIQAALSDKEPAVQAAVRRLVRAESGNAGR